MRAFLQFIRRSELAKRAYYSLRSSATIAVLSVSPVLLARLRYRWAEGCWPDFRDPKTFSEKLLWLNLYWRDPLKTKCGDKYTMRAYVEKHGLGHLLPRLFAVFEDVDEIDFEALPERFVLKCSHGCKCNIFCTSKQSLDRHKIRSDLSRWMAMDYSRLLGELHYAGMNPRIICEEFLDDGTAEFPADYKFYCFDGRVHCTLTCTGRQTNGKAAYDYFDRAWLPLPYDRKSTSFGRSIPRPAAYEEMMQAAEALSKPFPYVRMDFYCIKGRAILGEMTLTPSACIDTGYTELAQQTLGGLIQLPSKYP